MNPNEINARRLFQQHISHAGCKTVGELTGWLGAIQAQDYYGAKWSLGLRLAESRDAQIEAAIARGEIIRTWPKRGTLHYVAAPDVHWMLRLLTPRILSGAAGRHRELELDESIFGCCRDLFQKALQGGGRLRRAALMALLEEAGISTRGQRCYHILWQLAQEGLICMGPQDGPEQTFVLLDEWVAPGLALEGDAAVAELARRYFVSRGPANLDDFVWWSGLKISAARRGVAAVRGQLGEEKINGQPYWFDPQVSAFSQPAEQVYLLPGFDEYLLGYSDRSSVLKPQFAQQVCPGNNGMFAPTVVIGGQVRGTWKRVIKKNRVEINLSPFEGFSGPELDGIAAAAGKYGQYLGLEALFN